MSSDAISVSEFIYRIKGTIESVPYFNNAWVIGELSNFKRHSSGHMYFKIKDDSSSIDCVMFKTHTNKVLFNPKDGDKVVIRGSLGVYEARGTIQIYATNMNLDGLGDLYIRFEELKKMFFEKGYFDNDRKRTLPQFPMHIGVVTGKESAAYADIHRTLQERWPIAKVSYAFSTVQGQDAPGSIIGSLNKLIDKQVEVVVIARGGGSIEDLWGFNDPHLIEYLINYPIPFISGVGHESDTTLIDYISDYRAATPTAAAVHSTPSKPQVLESLRDYKNRYYKAVIQNIRTNQTNISQLKNQRYFKNPYSLLDKHQMRLDYIETTILKRSTFIQDTKQILSLSIQKMDYILKSKTQKMNQNLYEKKSKIYANLLYKDKEIHSLQEDIHNKFNVLNQEIQQGMELKKKAYLDIINIIDLKSPLKIMSRGFSLVYDKNELVKSIDQVEVGDKIQVQLEDGILDATVDERKYNHE